MTGDFFLYFSVSNVGCLEMFYYKDSHVDGSVKAVNKGMSYI